MDAVSAAILAVVGVTLLSAGGLVFAAFYVTGKERKLEGETAAAQQAGLETSAKVIEAVVDTQLDVLEARVEADKKRPSVDVANDIIAKARASKRNGVQALMLALLVGAGGLAEAAAPVAKPVSVKPVSVKPVSAKPVSAPTPVKPTAKPVGKTSVKRPTEIAASCPVPAPEPSTLPEPAVQDFPVEPACQNGAGGVLCSSTGFDTLINATLEYQGAAEACDLRLKSCTSSLLAAQELVKLRPSPPSKAMAIGGAAMAAIGAATIAAAVATTQLDDTARIGLGAVGAGVMAAGFIIVIP